MSSQVAAALIGVGVGAVLGFAGQVLAERWLEGRRERAAGRLIFVELVWNLASVSALRYFGTTGGSTPTWTAYNGHAAAIASSGSLERLSDIYLAYAALDDLVWLWGRHPDDTVALDELEDTAFRGALCAAVIAGIPRDEADRRLAAARSTPPRQQSSAPLKDLP